jgi:hypothetical protein
MGYADDFAIDALREGWRGLRAPRFRFIEPTSLRQSSPGRALRLRRESWSAPAPPRSTMSYARIRGRRVHPVGLLPLAVGLISVTAGCRTPSFAPVPSPRPSGDDIVAKLKQCQPQADGSMDCSEGAVATAPTATAPAQGQPSTGAAAPVSKTTVSTTPDGRKITTTTITTKGGGLPPGTLPIAVQAQFDAAQAQIEAARAQMNAAFGAAGANVTRPATPTKPTVPAAPVAPASSTARPGASAAAPGRPPPAR